MKKLFLLATCFVLAMNCHAQVVDNDFDAPVGDSALEQANDKKNSQKATGIEFRFVEDGFGFGYDLGLFDYFHIGLSYDFYKSIDAGYGYKAVDRKSTDIVFGGNYRYWFNNFLYGEGRAGIGYDMSSHRLEVNGHSGSTDSNYNFFGYLQPRIGVKVGSISFGDICIYAGYRADFIKFKTDSDYLKDYFTIGVNVVM